MSHSNKPIEFKIPDKSFRVWSTNSISSFHQASYALLILLGKSQACPTSACKRTAQLNAKVSRINYLLQIRLRTLSTSTLLFKCSFVNSLEVRVLFKLLASSVSWLEMRAHLASYVIRECRVRNKECWEQHLCWIPARPNSFLAAGVLSSLLFRLCVQAGLISEPS